MLFRTATPDDIIPLIDLLNDDAIAQTRENRDTQEIQSYQNALLEIIHNDITDVYVAVADKGTIVGMAQLFILPHISRMGAKRAQVESVRIASHLRGSGIGSDFMKYLMQIAQNKGCILMQLTTDKRRDDAKRFYERLGFETTHNGMKIMF